MSYKISRQKPGQEPEEFEIEYEIPEGGQRPTALDLLLHAQDTDHPDLAYRYGCRNGLCGVCTVDINGKPRLACKNRLKENDHVTPLSTLPVVRDFVVRRDLVNKQLQGRLNRTSKPKSNLEEPANSPEYENLSRCIECYYCLEGCPLHGQNTDQDHQIALKYGNPYAFLKIRQVLVDPLASDDSMQSAQSLALELGLDRCADCSGCKCGVGINLRKDVINPLLQSDRTLSS